jgi:predicted metal-dependent HD superfamily phosphohydrolase
MEKSLADSMFNPTNIATIKNMIMATKIPQSPHSLPEMILCDADLDYLGRADFEQVSDRLRREMMNYEIIKTEPEWNHLQVSFFEGHRYFTSSSQRDRNPMKMQQLEKLRQKI